MRWRPPTTPTSSCWAATSSTTTSPPATPLCALLLCLPPAGSPQPGVVRQRAGLLLPRSGSEGGSRCGWPGVGATCCRGPEEQRARRVQPCQPPLPRLFTANPAAGPPPPPAHACRTRPLLALPPPRPHAAHPAPHPPPSPLRCAPWTSWRGTAWGTGPCASRCCRTRPRTSAPGGRAGAAARGGRGRQRGRLGGGSAGTQRAAARRRQCQCPAHTPARTHPALFLSTQPHYCSGVAPDLNAGPPASLRLPTVHPDPLPRPSPQPRQLCRPQPQRRPAGADDPRQPRRPGGGREPERGGHPVHLPPGQLLWQGAGGCRSASGRG